MRSWLLLLVLGSVTLVHCFLSCFHCFLQWLEVAEEVFPLFESYLRPPLLPLGIIVNPGGTASVSGVHFGAFTVDAALRILLASAGIGALDYLIPTEDDFFSAAASA